MKLVSAKKLERINNDLKAVPMGFETIMQKDKLCQELYLKAVPMGFETMHLTILTAPLFDLKAVPMGFETEKVSHPLYVLLFKSSPYGI